MSAALEVALVTCRQVGGLDPDDQPLREALVGRGLSVEAVAWDDGDFGWAGVRIAVLRSTWDYFHRRDEFLAWVDRTAQSTRLFNPPAIVRWNTHKSYLRDLEARGCAVVPTVVLTAGSRADLRALLGERGWRHAVVKPAVSADAWETARADAADPPAAQMHLDRLLPARDMLVQPYLGAVESQGERCLVVIDGEVSHSVRKRSLWQGGRHAGPEGGPVPIAGDEAALARRVLGAASDALGSGVPWPPLYARVDMVRNDVGAPVLLELELCEPTLFLRDAPAAAGRLAASIEARLR